MLKDFNLKLSEEFALYIDDLDAQTICFEYPQMHNDISILQIIRIEIGALAEPFPSKRVYRNIYIRSIS